MYVKCSCQHLGTLNTEIDPASLNAGNSGLRNATCAGKLSLGQALQFADDAHGLTGRYINTLLAGLNLRISSSPIVMRRHTNDLDE